MKVFISWSGSKSHKFAQALKAWMPDVIQDIECFLSSENIHAGQQWLEKINTELAETSFGILCVTADNQESRWLNFEAGALAKKIGDENRVVPITFDFPISSLEYPLRQFNGVGADRKGMLALMKSVNETGPVPRSDESLNRAFDKWWPELDEKFSEIVAESGEVVEPEPPKLEDLVQEVLDVVRGLARAQAPRPSVWPIHVDLGEPGAVAAFSNALTRREQHRAEAARLADLEETMNRMLKHRPEEDERDHGAPEG